MKKFFLILGSLVVVLVLGGVIAYISIPRQKLEAYVTPEVRYVTVTNAKIQDSLATMEVQLEVTSKALPVFVDSMVYDFRLFNQSLAQGSQKFADSTKTGKVQRLSIPVVLDYKEAQKLVRQQFLAGEKLHAHIDAWCRFPVIGIRRFTFTREVDMAIPVLPGADILQL